MNSGHILKRIRSTVFIFSALDDI